MWWKIYFWVTTILVVIGSIDLYSNGKILSLLDWVDIVSAITAILGLYSYIYKKVFFKQKVWRIIFWANVIYITFWVLYYFTPMKDMLTFSPAIMSRSYTDQQIVLLDIILSLPVYYAWYKLGYSKSTKKK